MKRFYGILALLFLSALAGWIVMPRSLRSDVRRVVRAADPDAEVGVAVVREGRVVVSYHGKRMLPVLSTFKFPLALAVLSAMDEQGISLSSPCDVAASDLWPTWSPLRERYPEGATIRMADLLRYAVSHSDNCASDRLLREAGGIGAVRRYAVAAVGEGFDFSATERRMTQDVEAQRLNRATPEAMALLMDRFGRGELVSRVYGDFLWRLLIGATTGPDKLKAGLPEGTVLGHKTGSSDRDASGLKIADNDLGYVVLPDGGGYSICVFVTATKLSERESAALIARISQIVWRHMCDAGPVE